MPSYALCDLTGVRGAIDMAQRVAAALARGDIVHGQALAEQRIDADDFAIWNRLVLKMWSQPSNHRLFIFENLEHILGSVDLVDFLARLLARLPAGRQIAICSRQPLPLSLSRFAAPHELITLRADVLQFDRVDIRAAFAGLDVRAEALDQVARITRGWPVAVLLLARLAREGALTAALAGSSDVAFADLYDYLAEQVFESLGEPQFARLLTVAAIPHASGEEVALVLGDPQAVGELAAVARVSPFFYRVMDGAYEAHPLMVTMLHERYGDRCRQMLLQAAARLADHRPLRAAQLYLEAGDEDRAALLLESQFELFVSEMSPLFAEIVSRLDERVLLRHAGLWAAATVVRSGAISQRQWLYEALTARDQITPATPLGTRVGVLASLGAVLTNLGRHDEALECFLQFAPSGVELPQRYRGIQLLFRSAVAARRGRFNDAIALWSEAEPLFAEVSLTRAIALEEVVARTARFTQSREAERTLLDRAIALARESGAATVWMLVLQEAFFGAWLAGEDVLAARYAHELEGGVTPSIVKATELLRAGICGDLELLRRNEGFERPRFRHYAALVACATVAGELRPEFAQLALEAAEDAGDATCIVIASIACMECCASSERATLAERVRERCANVDAPRLRSAVDAYLSGSGDLGMLTPLIGRLRGLRSASAAAAASPVVISIADGSVRRNGSAIHLSNRERELLLYLALHRRACSRDELIGAIWPGREGNARSVVRVYTSRLRARLGDASVVRLLDSGEYRLSSETHVDFYDIERLVQAARSQPLLSTETRARLEAYSRRWSGDVPLLLKSWEWFTAFVPRVEEIARQTTLLLGYDSLERGRFGEAHATAERIIALDRCDEPAWELLIRATLAVGDTVGAQRELRKYREILAAELGAEPSSDLERLVMDTQPGRRSVTSP